MNLFIKRTGIERLRPLKRRIRLVDDMEWDHASVRKCDWVPGCFYLVRRTLIEEVGLFDPRYFLYYEEVDHCLAARKAGWDVVFYPYTTVVHIGGESAKSFGQISRTGRQIDRLRIESELLYFRKNFGLFGVLLHAVLVSFAGAIVALKDVLKLRPLANVKTHLDHVHFMWLSFWRTGFGTRPTR